MTDRIFYLPVKLISHNGGKHLLYIHPSQLRTEAGEGTLEQEISKKR